MNPFKRGVDAHGERKVPQRMGTLDMHIEDGVVSIL